MREGYLLSREIGYLARSRLSAAGASGSVFLAAMTPSRFAPPERDRPSIVFYFLFNVDTKIPSARSLFPPSLPLSLDEHPSPPSPSTETIENSLSLPSINHSLAILSERSSLREPS